MADQSNDPSGRRPVGTIDPVAPGTTRVTGASGTSRVGSTGEQSVSGTTNVVDRRSGSGAGIAMIVLAVFLVVAVLFSVIDFDTFGGGSGDDAATEGATVSGATVDTATGAGEPPVAIDTGAAGTEAGTDDAGMAPAANDANTVQDVDGAAAPATDGTVAPTTGGTAAPAATE